MTKLKCSVTECQRQREGKKEHCLPHHRQIQKHGKITNRIIQIRKKNRICELDGCGNKYVSNGYCGRHFSQFRRHGSIISVGRINAKSTGTKLRSGYVYVMMKGHPTADIKGYVKRSRLVWERNTGHVVMPPEIVHHKDEVKTNDEFNNLKLLPDKKAHVKEHGGRIGGARVITKEMVIKKMITAASITKGNLTIRDFSKFSGFSQTTLNNKFGWNKLKEELCIK